MYCLLALLASQIDSVRPQTDESKEWVRLGFKMRFQGNSTGVEMHEQLPEPYCSVIAEWCEESAVQRQTAVTAHLISEQLLLFAFAEQTSLSISRNCCIIAKMNASSLANNVVTSWANDSLQELYCANSFSPNHSRKTFAAHFFDKLWFYLVDWK